MAIRLSGMNSGLDTDAIVKALVTSYSTKKQKYEKANTKLEWSQDAWKSLNTKVYSLYSKISNLRYSGAYTLKSTSVSDNTKASVTASSTAVNGTQTLKITQLAQAAYLTGGQLDKGTTASTTMAELGYTGDGTINVVDGEGKSKAISVKSTSTIQEVVNQFKEAGYNASFDETNHRLFISSKATGANSNFEILGDANGQNALSALGLSTSLTTTDEEGNVVDTALGATYKKYAALGASGALDSAISTYNTADANQKTANAQLANLRNVTAYANAYNSNQSLYTDKSVDVDTQSLMETLAASNNGSLIDADSNIYNKISGKDEDGNDVYSYVNGDTTTYLSRVENTDEEGNKVVTYKKTEMVSDGFKDEGGKTYEVNENTATYTDDAGVVHTYEKQDDGSWKGTGDDEGETVKISETFKYVAGDEVENVSTVSEKADEINAGLGISDEEWSTFKANQSTINAFEKTQDTVLDSADEYSIESLVAAVKGGKSDYVEDLANVSEVLNDAEDDLADNALVADLAKLYAEDPTSDAYTTARTAFENQIAAANTAIANAGTVTSSAVKVEGQDAIIELNGAQFTNSSNSFSINGLTIEAKAITTDEITITTATDTQGIYDKIKDFLTEYNSIINEMCKLYNATSSKGYEPLTDEEKEEMSDSEIEKWEQKIKDALLRHDNTLNGIMSAMTNAMSKGININGKTLNLSSFGIHTLGYLNAAENENYAYHIDGDEDDVNTSGNADKLLSAIASEPDSVMEYFQQLASNLYNAIGDKMKSSSLSSAYTIYNDKQMTKQATEYKTLISEWEKRISDKEEYYYNKFSTMETALSKLNSTQSSLSGYFN